jgi:Na+-transporting NADH:ubiquinone oxidoreductase subunit NqrC
MALFLTAAEAKLALAVISCQADDPSPENVAGWAEGAGLTGAQVQRAFKQLVAKLQAEVR